ncbi:MAG: hypothetical protein CVU57_11035 [Deltaproteobacteria bacterium HGW-Deltaproteobacteria-15]|jgi:hypothetical protein|nr:MAG: hypothetical protein CVU57_11035 [Deltaproteobacteria bacterium HGW-Deltaproteobacteria-15]
MTTEPTTVLHDPREHIRGLQQLLISDTKRIGFLFGAGTSMARKDGAPKSSVVPGVRDMTRQIIGTLKGTEFEKALESICTEVAEGHGQALIEYILSNIVHKEEAVGKETLCGLSKDKLGQLRKTIEDQICNIVSVHKKADEFMKTLIHCDLAQWIAQATRKYAVEIFTTNYDYLLELGLEYHGVPYFDGFVGSFKPFFHPSSVEDLAYLPQQTKLWKLHGSLGWDTHESLGRIVRRDTDDATIIVFPCMSKYEASKKQPYTSFMDRLHAFLKAEDGVLITCGYSFGDQHINEVMLNGLERTATSHVIGLVYDDFDANSPIVSIAKSQTRLSIYGKKNAVIGGNFGNWQLRPGIVIDEPTLSLYFVSDISAKDSGKGEFILPDYSSFVRFLSFLNYRQGTIARGGNL